MGDSFIEQNQFRRILNRNVAVPLGFGFLSAFFFSGIVYYLLSVSHWVDQSVRGLSHAHEVLKLISNLEASMRGYLIAGEEIFLEPYRQELPLLENELEQLTEYARANPVQLDRVQRVNTLQAEWVVFAEAVIAQRALGEDITEHIRSKRGLELKQEQRRLLYEIIAADRHARNELT